MKMIIKQILTEKELKGLVSHIHSTPSDKITNGHIRWVGFAENDVNVNIVIRNNKGEINKILKQENNKEFTTSSVNNTSDSKYVMINSKPNYPSKAIDNDISGYSDKD